MLNTATHFQPPIACGSTWWRCIAPTRTAYPPHAEAWPLQTHSAAAAGAEALVPVPLEAACASGKSLPYSAVSLVELLAFWTLLLGQEPRQRAQLLWTQWMPLGRREVVAESWRRRTRRPGSRTPGGPPAYPSCWSAGFYNNWRNYGTGQSIIAWEHKMNGRSIFCVCVSATAAALSLSYT